MGNAYLGTSWGFVIKHSRKAEGAGVPRSSARSPTPGGTSTRWGWGGKPLIIGQRLLVSGSTAAKEGRWAIYAISGLPTQKEIVTAPTPADINAPASTAQSRAAMRTPPRDQDSHCRQEGKTKDHKRLGDLLLDIHHTNRSAFGNYDYKQVVTCSSVYLTGCDVYNRDIRHITVSRAGAVRALHRPVDNTCRDIWNNSC